MRERNLNRGEAPLMKGGPRLPGVGLLLVVGFTAACGGTSNGSGPVDDPWDRCPSPGPGVTVGGDPGSGDSLPTPFAELY